MSGHSINDALRELEQVGQAALSRAESNLKKKKVFEVARIYALVERESEKIEDEARKLMLAGKLHYETYQQLVEGYSSLSKGIMEMAKAYRVAGDVAVLGRNMKHSVDRQWGSLAQYLREVNRG